MKPFLINAFLSLAAGVFCSQSHGADYSKLLSQTELANHPNFVRVRSFNRIEPIKNGQILSEFKGRLDLNRLSSLVPIERLEIISVRDFFINIEGATLQTADQMQLVRCPFALSIRYKEKGLVKGALVQGTLNIQGILDVTLDNGSLVALQVSHFDDSQPLERIGRKLGFLDKYQADFIDVIAAPVLRFAFHHDDLRQEVLLHIATRTAPITDSRLR